MAEQQPELKSDEEPKRKQIARDSDAEATKKKRQVEIPVNTRPTSGGVEEIDRKAIMEHDTWGKRSRLNVDMDKKIVIVRVGKGVLEADMDKGIVKLEMIGKRLMKFNVGEGNPIEEEKLLVEEKKPLIEQEDEVESLYEDSDYDDDHDFKVRTRFQPIDFKC